MDKREPRTKIDIGFFAQSKRIFSEQRYMQTTFRPKFTRWWKQAAILLTVCIIFASVMQVLIQRWALFIGFISLGIFAVVWDILIPTLRNWIAMNEIGITGSINGKDFQISWDSFDAVIISKTLQEPWTLLLARKNETSSVQIRGIPIRWMDERAIYQQISMFVGSKALLETWDNLVNAEIQEKVSSILDYLTAPVKFGCYRDFQWVGIICGVLFSIVSLLSWFSESNTAIFFAAFAVLGFSILVQYRQTMEIDLNGITKHSFFGTDFMAWDEVTYLRTSAPDQSRMVLEGDQKRLVIADLEYWYGKEGEKAIEIFKAIIERRNIPIHEDRWMGFKIILSKNTKQH